MSITALLMLVHSALTDTTLVCNSVLLHVKVRNSMCLIN